MKRIVLAFLCCIMLVAEIDAQHCSQASVSITPTPQVDSGLNPISTLLPCVVQGQWVQDTLYFKNFNTVVNNYSYDSLKIDSIVNLPAGLCWVSNKSNNLFLPGEDGVIYITGSTASSAGQYQLKILVDIYFGFGSLAPKFNLANQGYHYFVRVKCPNNSCKTIDTAGQSSSLFIADTRTCISPPTATITPADSAVVCQGVPLTLTASSGTGYTYHWTTGATTSTISVTLAGTYGVTVYANGDSAVSLPTIVYSHGSAPNTTILSSGRDSFCIGGGVTLTANDSLRYHWNTGDSSRTIYIVTSGLYNVTVTNHNNCTAVSTPAPILAVPVPSVAVLPSINDTICQGDTALLILQASGMIYAWSNGKTTQSISITSTSHLAFTVSEPILGCHSSSGVNVVVYPLPIVSINHNGQILTATSSYSYQWFENGSALLGQVFQTIVPPHNGNYQVHVTNIEGCSAWSNTIAVTNVGIQELVIDSSIWLYPNPGSGIFYLETNQSIGERFEVADIVGKQVYVGTITSNKLKVDLSETPNGTYLLLVARNNETRVIHFDIIR